jgi:hypothetical protein
VILLQEDVGSLVAILIIQPLSGPTLFAGHFCGHEAVDEYPVQSNSKHCFADFDFDSDVLPAGHEIHALVAPTVFEYVPATQSMQTLTPAVPEYVPAGHDIHAAKLVCAGTIEYVPAAQGMHELEPVTSLYEPAGHAVHVLPAGPVYPALHTQSRTEPDVPSVREFGGHRLQFALPSGDHWPAGQY